MRQVFGWASRVVIWLGVETTETASAFQLLKYVNDITKFDGNVDAAPSQSDLTKVMMYLDADPSAEKSLSCLFHGLMKQEWWGRVWVIQEVAVSSRATVVIGRSELEWSSLYDAVGIIVQCGAVNLQLGSASSRATISSVTSLTNIENLRTRIRRGSLPSISTLVASNRQAATDPRDLVYAFLGLAQKYDDSLLGPNYSDSNSVSTVFLNLVQHAIRVERSLDIICRSQGESRNDLPSWCPDWTSPPPSMGWNFDTDSPVHSPIPLISNHASLLVRNTWHACGETTPAARIIRSPPTLACDGLFIDKIKAVGNPVIVKFAVLGIGLVINLQDWEGLILKYCTKPEREKVQPPDRYSIFDVSIQYLKLIHSYIQRTEPAGMRRWNAIVPGMPMILKFVELIIKAVHWPHRKLQMTQRKIPSSLKGGYKLPYIAGGTLAEAYMRTLVTNRLVDGDQMADSDYDAFWLQAPKGLNDPANPSQKSLVASMMQNLDARRLVITEKGYLGLGPTKAQKDDLLCVLYGCSVPVLLRANGEFHQFIGESYIHGLMDGAAVR